MAADPRKQFRARLQFVARRMPHQKLANQLGVSLNILHNWLYRDTPPGVWVQLAGGKLSRVWRSLR